MTVAKSAMRMPELLVFAMSLAIGFVGGEVWRSAFYIGANFATTLSGVSPWVKAGGILVGALLCLVYMFKREAHLTAARMGCSLRFDLLVAIGIGIWANELASPWFVKAHAAIRNTDPSWAPAILLLLCTMLLSSIGLQYLPIRKRSISQLYFIEDREIDGEGEDLLANEIQAKSFAETVLASGAHKGLVFGVDGPWGVGKTSFINLAANYWSRAEDKVIVCRFEPLRYASEPDLLDRLIRDLSAAIQRKVFAPEFPPAASRYSRMIKGKPDLSFLGFKISLESSQETVDELLDDIDDVLKHIDRRVIIVIDDLDRLDAKAVNNVLFATRRTFKLAQATYILCYDTEVLAAGREEGSRAREFLEKFVTVKLSLFVDSSRITDFLRREWQHEGRQLSLVPSDTMLKLGAVLSELADILDGPLAPKYFPLVGDLRKIKRFVNAMLLMQIEKSDLGRTDFNKRDLINLILLHLNYPGIFRRIYLEETGGRSGSFSVYSDHDGQGFKNSDEFSHLIDGQSESAKFLLTQLFDVKALGIDKKKDVDEAVSASRACFNQGHFRNLEGYLKLIVRFIIPEPQSTFVLYQDAVEKVKNGESITSILMSPDFRSGRWEHAHDQFWRLLVNQSYNLTYSVADDAIDTLVDYLPRYSSIESDDQSLRQRSIYSLLRLLDRAGWGRAQGRRLPNLPENVMEIARRIFGEGHYKGRGLLQRLSSNDRGVLGWNDLMLFRLSCSQDRQGQLYNLYSALTAHQDIGAPTTGMTTTLALIEMRELSQQIFAIFKRDYIDVKKNFFTDVDDTPFESFLGDASREVSRPTFDSDQPSDVAERLIQRFQLARSIVKSFVIYQLSNSFLPTGSGVGCGYYDEQGVNDGHAISKLMNEYVFGVCFSLDIDEDNVFHFLDHCLSHLSNSFFSGREEAGYFASKADISGGLDPREMGMYWNRHRELIRQRASRTEDRRVVTSNYIASYREDLTGVFSILDELAIDATTDAMENPS